MRPRLLDLFSGAGGAAVGYHRAGFDVTGVDLHAQPAYPFRMVRADCVAIMGIESFLDAFQVIHASPPCQVHSALATVDVVAANIEAGRHIDLIPETRSALAGWAARSNGIFVIENVPGAPLIEPLTLCGTEFECFAEGTAKGKVALKRHRLFESNLFLMGAGGCYCNAWRSRTIGVYGHGDGGRGRGWKGAQGDRRVAMGIDWMDRYELAQALPPCYTEFIGKQIMEALQ